MNYVTTPAAVMDAAIAKHDASVRQMSDAELFAVAARLKGRYLDRLGPREWAALLESRRRSGPPVEE